MLDKIDPTAQNTVRQTFTLNGTEVALDCDPFKTLANTLRDDLGLTGTKIGCDAGDCGACTILIDGVQACSCLTATGQIDGADLVTIEGGAHAQVIADLQQAFLIHGAAQCGICTPGMIMAGADLLQRNADPSKQDIEDALGGVLCRCTGYQKIIEAVASLAGSQTVTPLDVEPGPVVGTRIIRTDGGPKVDGTELYGADAAPADALWLRPIRSPYPHARFELGDIDSFVAETPGLEAILSAKDVPGFNGYGIFPDLRNQPVFGDGLVKFRGDIAFALVGECAVVANLQVDTLPVTWTPLPELSEIDAALEANDIIIHAEAPGNVLTRGLVEKGDVKQGEQEAAVSAEGRFTTSFVEHAYIEPEAGFAQLIDDGTRIEIVASTQAPYMDLDEIANVLGIEKSQVRIRPTACGGGFGGKLDVSVQPMLAVAAWVLKKPVRTVYSRIESMISSTKRHPAKVWARASADRQGRLTAFQMDADFNTGAYASWGPTVAGRVPVHATGPYLVPHVLNKSRAVYTHDNPAGAFRGFGVPQAAIAQESLFDDLAEKLNIDRLEFRLINAIRAGDKTATSQTLEHSCGLAQCLEDLKPDWQKMLSDAAQHNAQDSRIRRGAGIGCMWYGCGNTSLSNPSTMRVTLGKDGALTLYNGAVDIGQGSTTVILQICADALGLPPAIFTQVIGDTDLTEDAGKTSASRQTFVSGKASELAGLDLRSKILAHANVGGDAKLTLDGTQLRIEDKDAVRVLDLAALNAQDGIVFEGTGTFDPPAAPLDEKGQGVPYATYGFAAQIVDLEVDLDFGTVKLNRIVAAHDVGRAINPTLVEGQIHGGIAQGLGLALMEEYISGKTENLHDYLIPTFGDMPPIDIKIIEDPELLGPYGAKGIGEPALIPTAPAILSAIRHAAGITVTHVPALPHRIWAQLNDKEQRT